MVAAGIVVPVGVKISTFNPFVTYNPPFVAVAFVVVVNSLAMAPVYPF